MKKYLPFIFIIILAAVLRFYRLGENPPSLSWDEAAWGYNAYSLGLDGRDEFGRFLPYEYLESFGDFKPPVYAYLSILPVRIFGLNEFSSRFTSALFGTLTVLLTYFLVKELFIKKKKNDPNILISQSRLTRSQYPNILPEVTMLLLAISPWHILLSRAAFEANVASFFIVGGVTFFLKGLHRQGWWLILAALSFSLSLYTFNTARIVSPFLVFVLGIAFFKTLMKMKKWSFSSLFLGLILIAPLVPFLISPQAQLRFHEVNIFSDPAVISRANQEMANDNWTWWTRLLHNRRWGYFQEFLKHYFDHFNPAFLFIKGDGNPKFSAQDVGQFYLWELPFLVSGFFLLFKTRPKNWWLPSLWLAIGILPAATARETPHALRIETTLPTWQIITALGVGEFYRFTQKQKNLLKNLLRISCLVLLIANIILFLHNYYRHYPYEFSAEWQYGYKDAIMFVQTVENQYDEIWFTTQLGRPYIYFLSYLQSNPSEFRRTAQIEREVFGFVKVKSFGKYHFFAEGEVPSQGNQKKILFIAHPSKIPDKANVVKEFYLLNGQTVLTASEI